MLNKQIILCIAICLMLPQIVFAGAWVTIDKPASGIQIVNNNISISEGIYFYNPSGFSNPLNCSSSVNITITDAKLADRALALAIYAETIGRRLLAYVTSCNGIYMKADSVTLEYQ